jgi:hypothetical protein
MFERIAGGYQVDAQALHACAQNADTAGQSVEQLAREIEAALGLGVSGGLDIGAAVQRSQGAWSARLAQLAGEANSIGSGLTANAASYEQTESDVLATFTQGTLAL